MRRRAVKKTASLILTVLLSEVVQSILAHVFVYILKDAYNAVNIAAVLFLQFCVGTNH